MQIDFLYQHKPKRVKEYFAGSKYYQYVLTTPTKVYKCQRIFRNSQKDLDLPISILVLFELPGYTKRENDIL